MSDKPERIQDLSTHASILQIPQSMLQRYGRAIRGYLDALLGEDDGEEVAQAFAVKVLSGAFESWTPGRGRFRDYLKRAVWNFAGDHRRAQSRRPVPLEDPDMATRPGSPGAVWMDLYRAEVLRAALRALAAYQEAHPGNVFATLTSLLGEEMHGSRSISDDELAQRLSEATGKPFTPANARMQKTRARRKLAELLQVEVRLTLEAPTQAQVEDELRALGLFAIVEPYSTGGEEA